LKNSEQLVRILHGTSWANWHARTGMTKNTNTNESLGAGMIGKQDPRKTRIKCTCGIAVCKGQPHSALPLFRLLALLTTSDLHQ